MIFGGPVWLALDLATAGHGTSLDSGNLTYYQVMGRWTRYRLRIVVGLVLVGGTVGLVWVFCFLPAPERGNGLAALTFCLALVTIVHSLVGQESGRRSADSRPVDVLATRLAQAVYGQWHKAAVERRLVTPIPIRWSLNDADVAGSVVGPLVAAVGAPDVSPAFPPLPGHASITEEDLRAGGGRRELYQLFAGLASGRIVVVGAPGAGKSGAAILLVLDTLAYPDSLDDTERARVPVPVLFTGHGWDPNTTLVQDWLRDKLVETYALFQHCGGDADAATLIAARDKIALILDGLDEMDEALRPAALQALSDAPFRVMVLTRSEEMIKAASEAWLVGAVAVHLHDVTGPQAADYLWRARAGPAPAGWSSLLTQLREQPDGVLARGLSTPLPLTLLRDTYQAGDDVGELLDATRSAEAIEQHLIARVLPAAYTPRPGRPAPRYSEEQARQTLTCIARKMGNERDLAWWGIPDWAPVTPRILATGLVFGLVSGLGVALGNGLVVGLMYRLVFGLVFGLMYWLVFGIMTWLMIGLVIGLGFVFGLGFRPRVGLGVAVGLGAVFVFGLWASVVSVLAAELGVGLGVGLMYRVGDGEPRRLRIASWRAAISRQVLRKGLVLGTGCGLVIGLGYGFAYELGIGLRAGLIAGLLLWLAYILLTMFFQGGTSESSPLGPDKIWRNDRMVGLGAGLLAGLVAGCGIWFVAGLVAERGFGVVLGPEVARVFGLASGLAGLGVGVALTYPAIWPTTLAWRQLRRCGHVPAVSLMPFLEDARERGVLRTVGGVYQFRHATLQDQLAGQTTPSSAASRVS